LTKITDYENFSEDSYHHNTAIINNNTVITINNSAWLSNERKLITCVNRTIVFLLQSANTKLLLA